MSSLLNNPTTSCLKIYFQLKSLVYFTLYRQLIVSVFQFSTNFSFSQFKFELNTNHCALSIYNVYKDTTVSNHRHDFQTQSVDILYSFFFVHKAYVQMTFFLRILFPYQNDGIKVIPWIVTVNIKPLK